MVEIRANEFESASSALQHVHASGFGRAIFCGTKYLVVEDAEAEQLESAGVRFAYLHEIVMPNGSFRIVAVPVND